VKIVGVDERGEAAFRAVLAHGADPERVAHDAGFRVKAPIDAFRDLDADLVLRLAVEPAGQGPAPAVRPPGQDHQLVLEPGETPVPRQRLAAYAVVLSDWGLLATEYSGRTAVSGRWGMPGGGIDDGEEPAAAVVREVTEETSQVITLGALTRVQTSHWVGRSPHGTVEDFHAVRLIYQGECAEPSRPVVLDSGGTTESARWIPLTRWPDLAWTHNWRAILAELLDDTVTSWSPRRSGPRSKQND